ncbi:hypothetical protein NFI96_027505 [Prochilodus magdalenae]|nr:hypothetical protein NFI96_027505 [Prochilodus magdalenae]
MKMVMIYFQRDQLRKELLAHTHALHNQAKEQEKRLEQKEVVNKEEVEQAKKHNLELMCSQEEELAELTRSLEELKAQVAESHKEQQVWLHYKTVGSVEHQQQIQNLQSELTALQTSFEEISEYIKHSLDSTVKDIDKKTSQLMDEKKQQATEVKTYVSADNLHGAIKRLDKSSCQEVMENEWLRKEIANYHEEVSVLDTTVRRLEEENLDHMKQLFELRLSNLQIPRSVFLRQVAGLEQSVQKLTLTEAAAELGSGPSSPPESGAEAGGAQQQQQAVELERDETDPSWKPSSPPHDLARLLYGSQDDLREPLHLGPLEQKLLSVVGQAATLHPLPSDAEGLAIFHTEDWSITTRTIHNKFQ